MRGSHHQKEQADPYLSETLVLHPGDSVWLSTRNLALRLPCNKLRPRFVGPFKVLWRVNEVTYRLQLPSDYTYLTFSCLPYQAGGSWSPG